MASNNDITKVLGELASLITENKNNEPIQKSPTMNTFNGLTELQRKQARYQVRLANSSEKDYRMIEIPRLYEQYVGSSLEVGLNGSVVKIPVDGNRYKIHKDFYPVIRKKLRYVDEKVSRASSTDRYTGDTGDISEYQPH